MKFVIFSLLIISSACVKLDDYSSNAYSQFEISKINNGPYDQCILIVELIVENANKITDLIVKKEYRKIAPIALQIGKNIFDAIECFKNPKMANDFQQTSKLSENPTECVIIHMKLASKALQTILVAVTQQNWNEAMEQLSVFISEIQALNNCGHN